MADDALSVVQDVYGAFGRGDTPAILGRLSDDVAWEVEGRAGDYPTFGARRGPQGALEFFQAMGGTEDISLFEPQAFYPSGDNVVVEGHIGLTLKNNGHPMDYAWVHLFTVKGGKITRFKEFYDTAQVVEAWRA